MESGSGSKRPREISLLERKMREWGPRVIKAILRGERLPDFPDLPYDLAADEYRRRFPVRDVEERHNKAEADADERHNKAEADADEMVHPDRQFWRKELYHIYLKKVAYHKKSSDREEQSKNITVDYCYIDDKSDYEYPNIGDFMGLGEIERVNTRDFQRDMARYDRDEKISDGFDVGFYPYRDAAGFCGCTYFLFCHYKPPQVNLPRAKLNTLVFLSGLAISVYNMHQVPPTTYDNVQVVKAMKFGQCGTNLNLTFQASFPPVTFQTRLYDRALIPRCRYSSIEIVLVRKFKEGQDCSGKNVISQETDYVGAEFLPKFPSGMENISDFDEKDPQTYTLHSDSENKLPLYLSQLALYKYNHDHNNNKEYRDFRDRDKDEIYDNVKVLSTKKSLNDEHGTTYYITFEASLLGNSKNPQIFEAKLFMSPLIPTTKIKIKFVRIKPN